MEVPLLDEAPGRKLREPQAQPTPAFAEFAAWRVATSKAFAPISRTFDRRTCLNVMVLPLPGLTKTESAESG